MDHSNQMKEYNKGSPDPMFDKNNYHMNWLIPLSWTLGVS